MINLLLQCILTKHSYNENAVGACLEDPFRLRLINFNELIITVIYRSGGEQPGNL